MRSRRFTDEEKARIFDLRSNGRTHREIAQQLSASETSIFKLLNGLTHSTATTSHRSAACAEESFYRRLGSLFDGPDGWERAFCEIIPRWQEARERTGNNLEAMAYHSEVGAGKASNSGRTSVVRPSVSDFVADVELNAARALGWAELRYLRKFTETNRSKALRGCLKQ